MGLRDIFRKKKAKPAPKPAAPVKEEKPRELPKKERKLKEEKREARPREAREEALASKILVRPVITEKATALGQNNKYVFEVAPGANKAEIKKAIEEVYGVRPVKINIVPVRGKEVRYGRARGKTKAWKKAIITLKEGERIELYERK